MRIFPFVLLSWQWQFLCSVELQPHTSEKHDPSTCSSVAQSGIASEGTCSEWLLGSTGFMKTSEVEERLFSRYIATCREYGIKPSADVLNRLQLRSGRMVLQPLSPDEKCGDLELRALALLLHDEEGFLLRNVKSLDLSSCYLGPSSAMIVANMLMHPRNCLDFLDLSYQRVGPEGACAMASALIMSPSGGPRVLRLKEVSMGDDGGVAFVRLLQNSSKLRLELLDLQNNYISYEICNNLTAASKGAGIPVLLQGNRVYDEVLNAVTHGIGVFLVVIGCVRMYAATRQKPAYIKNATFVYSLSLFVLYLSSTLFHAFFALGHTVVHIFQLLDYTGIFILIAGSYTPFLSILFPGERWAQLLLIGMWTTAVCGIFTAAFYRGPFQTAIRLTFFLGMGWTAVACIGRIMRRMGTRGGILLIAGGVLYTGGVPFFVRGTHTLGFPDHAIWHIFVIAASITHYCCILYYVVERRADSCDPDAREAEAETEEDVQPKTRLFANIMWQRL
mmetsp:Transcript_82999/g.130928  ORF Transcript_82999/g.130928 Transcript_82999/m.130928 type:complete len:504 (-) Transcript_82999:131-1642(-)